MILGAAFKTAAQLTPVTHAAQASKCIHVMQVLIVLPILLAKTWLTPLLPAVCFTVLAINKLSAPKLHWPCYLPQSARQCCHTLNRQHSLTRSL